MVNKINWDKIKEYKKRSLKERLGTQVGDFMEIRTQDERVYKSKQEFFKERVKDITDTVHIFTELCLPPIIKDLVDYGTRIVRLPIENSLGRIAVNSHLRYSEEKGGYVLR